MREQAIQIWMPNAPPRLFQIFYWKQYSYLAKIISAYNYAEDNKQGMDTHQDDWICPGTQAAGWNPRSLFSSHVQRKRTAEVCFTRGGNLGYLTSSVHRIACCDTSSLWAALRELRCFFIWKFVLHSKSQFCGRAVSPQKCQQGKGKISFDWRAAIYSFLTQSLHNHLLRCTHIFSGL